MADGVRIEFFKFLILFIHERSQMSRNPLRSLIQVIQEVSYNQALNLKRCEELNKSPASTQQQK
jgi:hypothetical protein